MSQSDKFLQNSHLKLAMYSNKLAIDIAPECKELNINKKHAYFLSAKSISQNHDTCCDPMARPCVAFSL